ncbi:MAG TPA: acyltransferase [Chthoniobacteraceae bacterium]|nr:acyltransferase [Chthoniobacteraceae bacterium]
MRLSDLIRKIENALIGTKRPREAPAPAPTAAEAMEVRLASLRKKGVRIGEGCMIFTEFFSTEPYLVDIGNRVGISGGTKFLTHDASVWLIRPERPSAQVLGRIRVGDNTFIGEDCIILPGTTIGRGCVIAAGSVVRGEIPDNSIVLGNPGKIIGEAGMLKGAHALLGRVLDTYHLPEPEREAVIRKHFGL